MVTDHAPHLEEEKIEEGLAGVPGLQDYSHLVSWLIRKQGVNPGTITALTSTNPARFAGLEGQGQIEVGMDGSFTIVDLSSPERVRNDLVRSKCGWSPYEGFEFPGKARWTIRKGEELVSDFELVD